MFGTVVVAVAFMHVRQAGRRGKSFLGGFLGIVTIVNLSLLAGAVAALFGQDYAIDGRVVGAVALVVLVIARVLEGRRAAQKP